jgi:hypothetical protein
MRHTAFALLSLALVVSLAANVSARLASKAERPLAHMVFFTLKDHSKEARAKFLDSCKKLLTGHEGTTYFSIGTMAEDADEPGVSVKDFDVALHVVFESKAAKDKYLVHTRHKQFVDDNRASFEKVRVFDSYLESP